ncbi:PepSY-associated TM helix domain-containing protein [Streptomyces sp. SID5910]|uniref:PepSY-associated TM helix domain-containing protein n=1 Tax=Streptomyces sp. SID5910 TaxID=2690312 RepID=UPI0013683B1A|nr:PepSY-associated TM helix domain-containing protein [Streptomyces sp. SID5910]MYR45876.1 PepSY domain-containing protein [Streptomyces sp. SID5910]
MSESPPLPDTPATPPASPAADALPPQPDGATRPLATTGGGSGTTWGSLRPLLLRLHFYAGVVIGPFLLVAAVTGLAYTATPQIESILYHHELKVTPRGSAEPLAEQVAAAERAVPDGTLLSVTKGAGPTDSTRVTFGKDGLAEGYTLTAFVDPYDHEVLGTLETFGQWLPARAWLDDLHRNLHLGEFGRNYSELAASWLWVEVLGGLALWAGTPRNRRRLRRLVVPDGGAKGRRRTMSWHGAVGLWASIGLLGLSATGLTWSGHAGTGIGEIQDALGGSTPAVSTALPAAVGAKGSVEGAKDIGIDAAVASAHDAGLRGVLVVTPPAEAGTAYVVKENTRSWPVRQDSVAVAPATGEVTQTLRFDDFPVLAKLTSWGINAHMGLLFGLVNQTVLALLAIGLIAMILWGYRMWWLRRPTRGEGFALGRAPARGAWRRIPGRVLAPVAVVVAVIGYYLPLFGLPLLAFLVVDLTVGVVRRRGAGGLA